MSELLDLARSLVERAGDAASVEAFLTHEREFKVKVFDGEVESLSRAEPRGAGLRYFEGGRVGFAYTTDLTEKGMSDLLARARANSTHATSDPAVALPEPEGGATIVQGLVDDSLAEASADDKVAFARSLDRVTRDADPRVRAVEESVYSDSEAEVALASSSGLWTHYRRTDAWCYSIAIAEGGGDTEVGFEFGLARGLSGLDADDVGARAAARAVGVLGAKKIASTAMPVVFDPYVAGQFLGVIAGALTGEAVQKGRSLFAGKLGERVAAAGLDLIDDGTIPAAPGSAPWDDEGVPTRPTLVIEDGVLSSLLYDTVSARRDGRASTANAARAGFRSMPHPAASNLAFGSTGHDRARLLAEAGNALLVQDLHGVHSGANPISGDFSVGATGRLLSGGEPGAAVKEVTIAAPMLDILARIEAVATDLRWLPFGGSLGGATTLVAEMTVAGS